MMILFWKVLLITVARFYVLIVLLFMNMRKKNQLYLQVVVLVTSSYAASVGVNKRVAPKSPLWICNRQWRKHFIKRQKQTNKQTNWTHVWFRVKLWKQVTVDSSSNRWLYRPPDHAAAGSVAQTDLNQWPWAKVAWLECRKYKRRTWHQRLRSLSCDNHFLQWSLGSRAPWWCGKKTTSPQCPGTTNQDQDNGRNSPCVETLDFIWTLYAKLYLREAKPTGSIFFVCLRRQVYFKLCDQVTN